jgi:hypothetical protein
MFRNLLGGLLLFYAAGVAQAAQPYAGLEQRAIKALSEEQAADLLAGRGMSLALAAELNGFPGPLHTLELAEQLELSGEQRRVTEALQARMQADAASLGARLIEAEERLDRLFASRAVDPDGLSAALRDIGSLATQLREVHLAAHLEQTALMSPHQIAAYQQLRGYGSGHRHRGH